ncbi:MAG: hypothetical protein H6Q86_1531 [candidate division NC10 bacterium]|nr:hypothetical protein [candidate division NC10 bacterium]
MDESSASQLIRGAWPDRSVCAAAGRAEADDGEGI